MKLSIFAIFFTIAFLSRCHLRSVALPMINAEELDLEPETLGEGLVENALSSGPVGSRIIVVGDSNLLRSLKALDRSIPQLSLAERILTPERRDISQDLSPNSIIRRDTMRCMVGRVYRPCWEV
ncbi:pro-melanin-concentrating hormone, like [Hoplias malabaricus]|uniref:pro-melanin-concentrating hormone, like n=1 Tax=Hoplias malabaricus TaxID=27720 RepID=UPI0034629296